MPGERLRDIPGFNIDTVAAAAGDDPEILRMENLDTDLSPPAVALEATRAAIGEDDANSWLPFSGRADLKEAVAAYVSRRGGPAYDPLREIVITCGEGQAMLDALLCLTEAGDEVILTDPTYAGMLNRVRLVGAEPRLVPLHPDSGEWRLDLDALRAAVSPRSRVVFLNNASFPSGWVASDEEWSAVASLCVENDLWLLYWGGFEGVLFDGLTPRQPAALPGMRERTVTVGAPSSEQRMIGWRVGWVVTPEELTEAVTRCHIYNGLVASGFAQIGTREALLVGDEDLERANGEWERRRDETLRQLEGFPIVKPSGGWAALMDVGELGIDGADASARLLEHGVAATQMSGWGGEVAERYLRFVFSNEPVERIALLGERARAALPP
ncbi:MAG TPA: pyridoxal phosphate-dependent aminotransferase [Thermoleophilaceae bacterium]|nr:pyridoxal phosphate-dependent aminotransferase [Thermoleophilaceae bacterium]